MKFLFDAHLPRRLARSLQSIGYDAIHTLDLPNGNRTDDQAISMVATNEARIVVTKDSDFITSFLLMRCPPRLLLVSTGNINNSDLENLFLRNVGAISAGFQEHNYIELSRSHVIFHL